MADLTTESAEQILQRSIIQLAENSQITRFSPGSKARTILGVMAAEVERLENILSANTILSLVNGASGVYLDFLGELLGLERNRASAAVTSEASQSIRIYTPPGRTAGGMNSGRAIVIPGGTILSSSDGSSKFLTIGTVRLLPSDTEVFVGVRSIGYGPNSNISAGTLTTIDFGNYTSFPETVLLVENQSAIETGASEEADDFYRFRLRTALTAAEKANATSIRLAALSIASVSDVLILDQYRGVGTADILLDTVSGEVSTTTLIQARSAIDEVKAIGMNIGVRAPELAGLEIEIRPKYAQGASTSDREAAKAAIREAVSQLVAGTPIGGTLRVNDIAVAAKNANAAIVDIGSPNMPIDRIVLWRRSPVYGRAPRRLGPRADINLAFDERLILEKSLTDAIRIL